MQVPENSDGNLEKNLDKAPEKILVERIKETRRILCRLGMLRAAAILLTFLCGTSLLAVLAEHWLFKDGLNIPLRCGILTGQIFFVLYFVYRQIIPFFLYSINPVYAAVLLEKQASDGKNSLLNWLFLRRERNENNIANNASEKIAGMVLEGVAKNAVQNVSSVSSGQTIEEKYLRYWGILLFSILIIFAAYFIFSPKNPLPSIQRLFLPFSSAAVPQTIQFTAVEPGNTTVLQGSKVNVSVKTASKFKNSKEPVELFFTTDDGFAAGQSLTMNDDGNNVWSAVFPPGKQGCTTGTDYWFQQGTSKSTRYRIEVLPVASLELETVKIKEPDYTGLPERTQDIAGDIAALEGSEVQMSVRSSLPLEKCTMFIETGGKESEQKEMKELKDNGGKKFQVRFNLQTAENNVSTFYFQGLDKNENKSRNSGRFRLEVLPDLPPSVKWVNEEELLGAGQIEVPLNSSLELKIQASDPDYALRGLKLHIASGNKQIQPLELLMSPSDGAAEHTGIIEKTAVFSPVKSRLTVGDTAEIWAEAVDTKLPISNKTETPRLNIKIVESKIDNDNKTEKDKTPKDKQQGKQEQDGEQKQEGNPQDNGKTGGSGEENREKEGGEKKNNEEKQTGEKDSAEKQDKQSSGENAAEKPEQNREEKKEPQEGQNGEQNKEQEQTGKQEQPVNGEENPGDAVEKILEQMEEDKKQQQKEQEQNEKQNGNQSGNQNDNQNDSKKEKNEEENNNGKSSGSGGMKGAGNSGSEEKQNENNEDNNGKGNSGGSSGSDTGQDSEKQNGEEQKNGNNNNPEKMNGKNGNSQQEQNQGGQSEGQEERGKGEHTDTNDKTDSKTGSETKGETKGGRQKGNPNSEESKKKDEYPDADKRNIPVDPNDNGSRERADLDASKDERRNQGGDRSNPKPVPRDLPNDTLTSGDEGHGQESTDSGRSERLQQAESGKEGQTGNQAESQEKQSGGGSEKNTEKTDNPGTDSAGEKQNDAGEKQSRGGNTAEKCSEIGSEKNNEKTANPGTDSAGEKQSGGGNAADKQNDNRKDDKLDDMSRTAGGTGGGADFNTDTETEAARMDYAEKTTNLVLEYLDEQLKDKPNQKLLDKLGWTEEQLRAYHKKWKELAEQSKQNERHNNSVPQKPDQWKEFLKSIGLVPKPQGSSLQQSKTPAQDNKSVTETQRFAPPEKIRERFKRYTEGIGK
ncbi:hypothetical protein FACS18942_05870 [Planctomycetales bacterium]|nr:hypothetical protein FACS18942_05870 [Planctomycetales bacterium]